MLYTYIHVLFIEKSLQIWHFDILVGKEEIQRHKNNVANGEKIIYCVTQRNFTDVIISNWYRFLIHGIGDGISVFGL